MFIIHWGFAQDISGTWEGYLDQSAAAKKIAGYKSYWEKGLWKSGSHTHDLKMTFKYDKKKKYYTGEYYITEAVNKSHYARFGVKAFWERQQVRYSTTGKLFEVKNTLNWGFCHNKATLRYHEDDQYEYLEGPWKGWDDQYRACASAHVQLRRRKKNYKPKPKPEPAPVVVPKDTTPEVVPVLDTPAVDTVITMIDSPTIALIDTPSIDSTPAPIEEPVVAKFYEDRKIITKETMHVNKDSILIQVWDHNREDGDIITLKFNNEILIEHYTLTLNRKSFKVYLRKGENILTLIAHNLGEIPPNTASVSIERTEGKKVLTLKSDMDKSESIKIIKE